MKKGLQSDNWAEDVFKTVGDERLRAWATGPASCRIQTSLPAVAKLLRKLPDCERVGFSVAGAWVAVFAMPYTLRWVAKNVCGKLTPDFPRKNEVPKTEINAGRAFAPGEAK